MLGAGKGSGAAGDDNPASLNMGLNSGQYSYPVVETRGSGSDTRKVIMNKALETLTKQFGTDRYRFHLAARWIPRRLLSLEPDDIQAVELQGGVERYTNFEVVYGNQGRRARIQLAINTEQQLPVPKRRIQSGRVIEAEDLSMRWVSVAPDRGPFVRSIDELQGKTLRQTLAAGQPVRQTEVGGKYIIRAGDAVKMIFKQGGVQVQLAGEARQDGAKGEEIRIYSRETRKKYLGKILGPGVVQWQKTLQ